MPTIGEQDTIYTRHPGDGSISSKSATAMRHLLVASMIFPFCASLISIVISIYMNRDTDIHPGWGSIMHGMQNFVSTLSINLILNMRVAQNEPSHSEDCDHVRTCNQQMTWRRRFRDTESTDDWESTDFYEVAQSRTQSRKPSVVSFDLNQMSPTMSEFTNDNPSGDINAGLNPKTHLSASRQLMYIPQTPISSRRTSFVTTPSTSHTTITITDASTPIEPSSIETFIPVHKNPESFDKEPNSSEV